MAIISTGQTPKLANAKNLPKTFQKFINSMLIKNPDMRLNCSELIKVFILN